MQYRIEYQDNRRCTFANGSRELVKKLGKLKTGTVADIRKLFKSGASDSVMDIYQKHIGL